jgi:NADH-quinone oxidoreductase subunit N
MMTSYWTLTTYLLPEIVMIAGAFLVMMLDLNLWRGAPRETRFARCGAITLAAFAAGGVLTIWRAARPAQSFFNDTLVVDPLNNLFALVIIGLSAFIALLSLRLRISPHVGEYFAMLIFAALGMIFMVFAEELIIIFVALELTSVSLFALTAFEHGLRRSAEAAVKYILYGALATAFMFFGFSLVCGLTGETMLRRLGPAVTRMAGEIGPSYQLLIAGIIFTIVGFAYKLAAAPFHAWAPDVYEGSPTAVTAYISSASKVAAFLVLTKILFLALPSLNGAAMWGHASSGWILLLAAVASVSMILGNLVAIVQKNVKRLLAYSSIAHGGYVLIGLVAYNHFGLEAMLYYLVVYAITNIGAFGVIIAVARVTGGDTMDHINGIGKRAPLLSLLMIVLILSLAGVPPMGGFLGKFLLFSAAIQADTTSLGLLWLVTLGIVMSAISLYYYLLILKRMYIEEPSTTEPLPVPRSLTLAIGVCAFLVLYLGIYPNWLLHQLSAMTERLL